jgi:hypothetical protein
MTRDKLLAYLNSRQAFSFTGADALALAGPVVYVLFRGEQVMYVGMSRNGISRPTSLRHHALKIEASDELQIFPMPSKDAALRVERALIHRLRPEWNERWMPSALLASHLGMGEGAARDLKQRLTSSATTSDNGQYVRAVDTQAIPAS